MDQRDLASTCMLHPLTIALSQFQSDRDIVGIPELTGDIRGIPELTGDIGGIPELTRDIGGIPELTGDIGGIPELTRENGGNQGSQRWVYLVDIQTNPIIHDVFV